MGQGINIKVLLTQPFIIYIVKKILAFELKRTPFKFAVYVFGYILGR
jgi:hypothetical protein